MCPTRVGKLEILQPTRRQVRLLARSTGQGEEFADDLQHTMGQVHVATLTFWVNRGR